MISTNEGVKIEVVLLRGPSTATGIPVSSVIRNSIYVEDVSMTKLKFWISGHSGEHSGPRGSYVQGVDITYECPYKEKNESPEHSLLHISRGRIASATSIAFTSDDLRDSAR